MKRNKVLAITIGLIVIALIFLVVFRNSTNNDKSLKQANQQNAEDQKDRQQNGEVEKRDLEYRNNWYKYITVNCIGYQPYHPEGIKDWTLTISNTTTGKLDFVE